MTGYEPPVYRLTAWEAVADKVHRDHCFQRPCDRVAHHYMMAKGRVFVDGKPFEEWWREWTEAWNRT